MANSDKRVKKTNEDVINFHAAATSFLSGKTTDTKLTIALRRVLKQTKVILEDYNAKITDYKYEHCLTDPNTGAILREPANNALKFSVEKQRLVDAFVKKLYKSSVFIEPVILSEAVLEVDKLPYDFKEIFAGFVAPPLEE